ncbi:hypothetical protein [Streptomyces radiopugnans]|uniref:Uncharacterized protein n=1 Tax=Streptomyces radiopugnans TaxID=403935 RepID=A0A1H9F4Z9_9ACTN|nr:hypothetical protein [Streptomyces radiopugnans]SEQ32949.1 hypothetical protein SAMN05216481_10664 [Streptomyces radiopugnans]
MRAPGAGRPARLVRRLCSPAVRGADAVTGGQGRLRLPADLPAPLGYDAVGVDAALGPRITGKPLRAGCVFADAERWWWIVPSGADIGVAWPPAARYAAGALVAAHPPGSGPRLAHRPEDGIPYTHPVVLYIAVCNAVGVRPVWTERRDPGAVREPPRGRGPGGAGSGQSLR